MSSSIGGSSALHLALLNQLLQRVGVSDQESVDGNSTADATQADGNNASFNSQADALFNSLDSDGDGKLSKSEFRTGFQKLSQDMRSVLLDQQSISDGDAAESAAESASPSGSTNTSANTAVSAFNSFDADGDGTVSPGEFNAGTGAAKLLDSLLQSATAPTTDTGSPDETGSSTTATTVDGAAISSDEMEKLLNNLRNSQPGDVANVPAMMRLRQSTSLHAAVTDLLQAIQPQQASAADTTGAPAAGTAAQS